MFLNNKTIDTRALKVEPFDLGATFNKNLPWRESSGGGHVHRPRSGADGPQVAGGRWGSSRGGARTLGAVGRAAHAATASTAASAVRRVHDALLRTPQKNSRHLNRSAIIINLTT